jgi:hypothetical protein
MLTTLHLTKTPPPSQAINSGLGDGTTDDTEHTGEDETTKYTNDT